MKYKELPERLYRKIIYESDYVCLYADKVKMPGGYTIENYHLKFLCFQNPANGMSDCVCHVFAAKVQTETTDFDKNEVKTKKWVSKDDVLKMLKNNETKDGVSILSLLFAFEFYK